MGTSAMTRRRLSVAQRRALRWAATNKHSGCHPFRYATIESLRKRGLIWHSGRCWKSTKRGRRALADGWFEGEK